MAPFVQILEYTLRLSIQAHDTLIASLDVSALHANLGLELRAGEKIIAW